MLRRYYLRWIGFVWALAWGLLLAASLHAQAPTPAASTASGLIQDLGWSEQSAYNSNAGGNNASPLPTLEQDVFGFIDLGREDEINGWSLEYRPLAQFYLSAPNLDGLSHSLRGSFHFMPSERWRISGRAWAVYVRGIPALATGGAQALSFHPRSNVYIPNVREADTRGRLALDYLMGPRASFQIFAGYQIRRFPHANYATNGVSDLNAFRAGLGYQLQATPRTNWALVAEYHNLNFGPTALITAESLDLTWTHRFTHQASLRLFAGPEYSDLHETMPFNFFGLPLILHIHRNRTYPSFGGVFWERRGIWTWQVGARQQISNGGGIFPVPVVSDTITFRLDHPLINGWHSRFGADYGHLSTLSTGILSAHVHSAAIGMDLRHKITDHLALNLDGNYLWQRAGGFLHVPPAVNRTFAGVRLSYDWRGWPNSE